MPFFLLHAKDNYKWNDNFAEARNCSITLANNEWILVLDSDEWIDSADMNLINSILLQSDSNIVGRIERINDINLSGENVKGTSIIFSSHRMEHVEFFCESLVILVHGKTVLKGNLKQIKEDYQKKNTMSLRNIFRISS